MNKLKKFCEVMMTSFAGVSGHCLVTGESAWLYFVVSLIFLIGSAALAAAGKVEG